MFHTNNKRLWWVVAAVATLGVTGCIDPFQSAPNPNLAIQTVMAVDQNLGGRPLLVETPGNTVVLDKVPRHNSRIYVIFNRPIDGTTITKTPTTNTTPTLSPTYCVPADNVGVTMDVGAGPVKIAAQVCYDPTVPAMVVDFARGSQGTPLTDTDVTTCFGPEPWDRFKTDFGRNTVENFPQLNTGATYVITATGVKDHSNHSIDVSVTLNVAKDLELVSYDPDYNNNPLNINTAFTAANLPELTSFKSIAVAAPTDPAPVTGVPVGILNSTTGLYSVATNGEYLGNYDFGTQLRFNLNDTICIGGARKQNRAAFCEPTGNNSGPMAGVTLSIGTTNIGYSAISDYQVNGDIRLYYAAPYLPLEDDTDYVFAMDPATVHAATAVNPDTAIAPPVLTAPVYGKFHTAAGTPRVVWTSPLPMDASTPADLLAYPVTSTDYAIGWLGLAGFGIATSGPVEKTAGGLPVATEIGIYDANGNAIPGLTSDVIFGTTAFMGGTDYGASFYGDDRDRFILFGANAGHVLNLAPATTYTIKAKGLKTASGAPIADYTATFRTMNLDYDPVLPGWVNGSLNVTVGGASGFKPGTGNMDIVSKRNEPATYTIQIPADIMFADPTVPANDLSTATLAGDFDDGFVSGVALMRVFKPTTGTVTLTKTSDGTPVVGSGGVVLAQPGANWVPFYDYIDFYYPGSWIGFKPVTRLAPNTQYTMVASGLTARMPDGSTKPVPDITYPFTTRPFTAYVLDQAGWSRNSNERRKVQLANGANNTVVDAANPLIVVTTGTVNLDDPATFPAGAVRLLDNSGGGAVDVPVTIEPFDPDGVGCTPLPCATPSRTATRMFKVTPASQLPAPARPGQYVKPGTQYTLLITDQLKDAPTGTPVARYSVSFITAAAPDLTTGVRNLCTP